MPIPPGEFQRMRDEEMRRALAYRQIRRERWKRRLPWLFLGVAILLTLVLFGDSLLSLLFALSTG